MQNSLNTALLFVIALGTSIIAVELVPLNIINKGRLLCLEYNSIYLYNLSSYEEKREKAQKKLQLYVGENIDIEEYCRNI